jgi:hypothetical protein
VAHARRFSEGFEGIEQLPDPAVGGVEVIRGDIFPNVVESSSASALRT